MVSGRLRTLFISMMLGCFLFMQPVQGKEGRLDEQQKLLDEAKQLNEQEEKMERAGQYGLAIPICERALAIQRGVLGLRHLEVATSLNNLANLYVHMGQPARAEPLHREALQIRKEALGLTHLAVANSMSNLAVLYGDMGQYAKAEPLHHEALRIRKEALGPRHPDVATSLNNLATLYGGMGQYAKAEPLHQEALRIRREALGPRHPDVANSLNNLATLYGDMGQHAKAEPLYQEALAIRKEALGPRHPGVANSINNLAILYGNMGQYDKAEPLYQEALAIRKETLGPRHPGVASALYNQALRELTRPERTAAAIPLLKQSLDIYEQLLRTIVTESRLDSRLQQQRGQDEAVYSLLAQNQGIASVQQLALSVALLRKGRSAEEGIKTQHAIQQALTNSEDRRLFDRLTYVRSQLASLYLKEPSSLPDYRKSLTALESEADELELNLAHHSAAFHTLQFPELDEVVVRVAQALPKDAALVEWLAFMPRRLSDKDPELGAARYMALVLFPNQKIRVVDLGEVHPIEEAIAALQERLSNRRPDFLFAAQRLHRLVMAPLQQALEGRTKLLVSPDGAMNLVPLWALHDGQKYVLDTHRITYLASGRDLLRPQAAAPSAPNLIVLANPEFRSATVQGDTALGAAAVSRTAFLQQLQHVSPLPGTGAEAQAIKKLFPQARLLMGREASERALRTLRAPAVLHIATHGVFWEDPAVPFDDAYQPERTLKVVAVSPVPHKKDTTPSNPLARSALLLAGVEALGQPGPPPPEDNDGLVTAIEVSGLNLWGTQLVVLSACDTGRGAVRLGQGVYGLRRAFLNAGAETLVSSLWPVSDAATQGLMDSYYRNLFSGQGRVEAMRQAAMEVRAKQPHPYYWAPFIVLGMDGPLRGVTPQGPP